MTAQLATRLPIQRSTRQHCYGLAMRMRVREYIQNYSDILKVPHGRRYSHVTNLGACPGEEQRFCTWLRLDSRLISDFSLRLLG